jgi:hypothetical protein
MVYGSLNAAGAGEEESDRGRRNKQILRKAFNAITDNNDSEANREEVDKGRTEVHVDDGNQSRSVCDALRVNNFIIHAPLRANSQHPHPYHSTHDLPVPEPRLNLEPGYGQTTLRIVGIRILQHQQSSSDAEMSQGFLFTFPER